MRRVLITGGASGIGAACVRRFQGDGCSVAVLDRDEERARREPRGVRHDLRRHRRRLARPPRSTRPRPRSAGSTSSSRRPASPARGTVADTDPDDWDRVLAVNLRGVYLTGRAAIPHLRAAGGGAIVNIASQLGLVAAADAAAYCASKGAVDLAHARDGDRPRARGDPRQLRLPGADRHAAARSRTSAPRRIRRPSGGPTRRCSCTRASSRPMRSPVRWPTSPSPARARRWAQRSSSMGGTSSDDRASGRRHRRDRHAGRPLARLRVSSRSSGRARAARVRARRRRPTTTAAGARGRPAPRLDEATGRPQNFLAVDIDLHLQFYELGIGEVTARDRYAGMLVGKHLAGIYRQRYGTQAALEHEARARRAGQGRRVRRARRGAVPRAAARAGRPRRGVLAQLRAAPGLRPPLAVALQGRSGGNGKHADRPARRTASSRSRRPRTAARCSRTRSRARR